MRLHSHPTVVSAEKLHIVELSERVLSFYYRNSKHFWKIGYSYQVPDNILSVPGDAENKKDRRASEFISRNQQIINKTSRHKLDSPTLKNVLDLYLQIDENM